MYGCVEVVFGHVDVSSTPMGVPTRATHSLTMHVCLYTCSRVCQVEHGVRARGGVETKYSASDVWMGMLHCVVKKVDDGIANAVKHGPDMSHKYCRRVFAM